MKKILSCVLITGLVSLTACNSGTDEASSSVPVGDFNFISQTEEDTSSEVEGNSSTVSRTDNLISGELVSSPDTDISAPVDDNSSSGANNEYISEFKDLESNSSIQIGKNIYLSLPSRIFENTGTLDEFIEQARLALNMREPDEFWGTDVQQEIHAENKAYFYYNSDSLFISSLGLLCTCRNVSGLDKNPSISDFNLGTLAAESNPKNTFTFGFSELGDKLSESDEDFYYSAVYAIADLKDSDTRQAKAVYFLDKITGASSLCVIQVIPELIEKNEVVADLDFLISSVRYSTAKPDNIISLPN